MQRGKRNRADFENAARVEAEAARAEAEDVEMQEAIRTELNTLIRELEANRVLVAGVLARGVLSVPDRLYVHMHEQAERIAYLQTLL